VKLGIAENAVDGFDYYRGYTFVVGKRASQLELWGFPWWLADAASAPTSGGYSTAFSSAFDGGLNSPTAPAFGRGFSTAFG